MDVDEWCYDPESECGKGGNLTTCIQRQSLKDFQLCLLEGCDVLANELCRNYVVQSDRMRSVAVKILPELDSDLEIRRNGYLELQ